MIKYDKENRLLNADYRFLFEDKDKTHNISCCTEEICGASSLAEAYGRLLLERPERKNDRLEKVSKMIHCIDKNGEFVENQFFDLSLKDPEEAEPKPVQIIKD